MRWLVLLCFAWSASGDLGTEVKRLAEQKRRPFWIGYQLADVPSPPLKVLLKIEKGRVTRVQSFTTECNLDAAGERLFWLREVTTAESVALLRTYLSDQSAVLRKDAIGTIGAHAALRSASNPTGADRHAPPRKGGGNDRGVSRVQ